jgi:hypothetical protein
MVCVVLVGKEESARLTEGVDVVVDSEFASHRVSGMSYALQLCARRHSRSDFGLISKNVYWRHFVKVRQKMS